MVPLALMRLFAVENFGKQRLKIADAEIRKQSAFGHPYSRPSRCAFGLAPRLIRGNPVGVNVAEQQRAAGRFQNSSRHFSGY
jgi:hypothetical protein